MISRSIPTYLWLLFAAVATLAIPPLGAISVNDMALGTNNFDIGTRD